MARSGRNLGGYNLGGIKSVPTETTTLTRSATGQIPDIGPFQLIDRDTPVSAHTHTSFETGETWELVFSDEFNNPGRTFWAGGEWSLLGVEHTLTE
jgi:beta-glucanase (GH16 family)